MPEAELEKQGVHFHLKSHPTIRVSAQSFKMSKSRGNVVNPDDVVKAHGADVMRLYEMFMGPLEAMKPWQTSQISGVVRFRDKLWSVAARPRTDAIDGCESVTARPLAATRGGASVTPRRDATGGGRAGR